MTAVERTVDPTAAGPTSNGNLVASESASDFVGIVDAAADENNAEDVSSSKSDPQDVFEGSGFRGERFALLAFIGLPSLALIAAIPVGLLGYVSWTDGIIAIGFYVVTCLGITVGFHRYFTHNSFKANRALRITLALMGSLALQGPTMRWVADHRRHHMFSDKEGDPHSPWRYGTSGKALAKGLWHSHVGWMFDGQHSNRRKYTPDLLAAKDIVFIDKIFGVWVGLSMLLPPLIGGLVTMSWQGALTAWFWGFLVRVGFLHHITWCTNSICHVLGERPFKTRDRSSNVWPLALFSFGESFHNMHHADPTAARHGVLRGQIDGSARLIWAFEKLGWAWDVRWPTRERLAKLRGSADGRLAKASAQRS